MKRFFITAAVVCLMGTFSACAHKHSHGDKGCGGGAKCEDCAQGHCKTEHSDKEKCDGHCETK